MEITETRKQIIEIIEPFMDKTLSEGCLIRVFQFWDMCEYMVINHIKDWYINFVHQNYTHWLWIQHTEEFIKSWDKILWHYDITAVLKYINSKWYTIDNDVYSDNLVFYIDDYYWVPNKPLHLYTEEEDKNLLDLLKNIWQK